MQQFKVITTLIGNTPNNINLQIALLLLMSNILRSLTSTNRIHFNDEKGSRTRGSHLIMSELTRLII